MRGSLTWGHDPSLQLCIAGEVGIAHSPVVLLSPLLDNIVMGPFSLSEIRSKSPYYLS